MKLKGTKLHKFELYLSEDIDERLIQHLEQFRKSKRMNSELRRLLYAGLEGPQNRVSHIPRPIQTKPIEEVPNNPVETGVKARLKKTFGGFEGE